MSIRDIFSKERENIVIMILSILAWFIAKQFDYFYFAYWVNEDFAFVAYLFGLYLIYFIVRYSYLLITTKNKVNVVKSQSYYDEHFKEPLEGRNWYGYLDVFIPYDWVITNCYVTLEKIVPVYYEDKILLDENSRELSSENIRPEYKMLHWRSPLSYQNGTKINIGENSNRETFSIGKIVTRKSSKKIKKEDIKTFSFDVAEVNPNFIRFQRFGLYEFSIIVHWNYKGWEMKVEKRGYVYSRAENGIREIRVGVGDYKNDNTIPKPVLKVEKENEQSKE